LGVNNYRWAGVPVYVRTGKGMKRKVTQIVVNFKRIPSTLFPTAQPNCLVLELQPKERVSISWQVKVPGESSIREQSLDFSYRSFKEPIPEAYERLLADIIAGDRTLFTRGDEAEAQWAVVMPILNHWQSIVTNNGNLSESDIVHQYPLGSDGPAAAQTILEKGHNWRSL
jgi:glucose-6-phosphate 1-dehydrogenase